MLRLEGNGVQTSQPEQLRPAWLVTSRRQYRSISMKLQMKKWIFDLQVYVSFLLNHKQKVGS